MDYVVAICSYKREGLIQEKTLHTIRSAGIDPERTYIFVADEEQKGIYERAIPSFHFKQIVVARPGLSHARNFVLDHFALGQRIVFLDDDISAFKILQSNGALAEPAGEDLDTAFQRGFSEAEKARATLWGVAPVPNGFFMRLTISTDLKFCVGPCFGMINPGATTHLRGIELPPYSEKEDYIRTLMCWDRDRAVVRLNWLSVKTAYYKQSGGISTEGRLEREQAVVKYIKERWPLLVRDNVRRKSAFPEILLKKPKKGSGFPEAPTEPAERLLTIPEPV